MTPRPPTHREPTDEEMQCLPEGALRYRSFVQRWEPSDLTKTDIRGLDKAKYAVPITKQEEDPEAAKAIEIIKQAQAKGWKIRSFTGPTFMEIYAEQSDEAMLAARNNQPEKV